MSKIWIRQKIISLFNSFLPLYIDVNVMLHVCIHFTLFSLDFFICMLICFIYITTFNLLCYPEFTTSINPIDISKYEYFKIKLTLIKCEIQSFWVFQTASCFDFHVWSIVMQYTKYEHMKLHNSNREQYKLYVNYMYTNFKREISYMNR